MSLIKVKCPMHEEIKITLPSLTHRPDRNIFNSVMQMPKTRRVWFLDRSIEPPLVCGCNSYTQTRLPATHTNCKKLPSDRSPLSTACNIAIHFQLLLAPFNPSLVHSLQEIRSAWNGKTDICIYIFRSLFQWILIPTRGEGVLFHANNKKEKKKRCGRNTTHRYI